MEKQKTTRAPFGLGIAQGVMLAILAFGECGNLIANLLQRSNGADLLTAAEIALWVAEIALIVVFSVTFIVLGVKAQRKMGAAVAMTALGAVIVCGMLVLQMVSFFQMASFLTEAYSGSDSIAALFLVVPLSCYLSGGLGLTGGAIGVAAHRKQRRELAAANEEAPADEEIPAPDVERDMAALNGEAPTGTEERQGKEKSFDYPSPEWFARRGAPLSEIPMEKRAIKQLSFEEKTVVAWATFAVLKKKMIFASCVLPGALLAIGISCFFGWMAPVCLAAVTLFGGGFLLGTTGKLYDGFDLVRGASLLRLPLLYRIWFSAIGTICSILAYFSSVFYLLLNMVRREKWSNMPRVAMPKNCGFDELIGLYSEFERRSSFERGLDQSMAYTQRENYEDKKKNLKILKKEVESSELSWSAKQTLLQEIESTNKKNDEVFERDIKPRL